VTATFFLSGVPGPFWWQDLQRAVDGGLVDSLPHVDERHLRAALAREEKAIFRVAAAIEALPRAQRDETAAALRAAAGTPSDESLDAPAIRTLVGAGAEVGFHTLRHEALPALGDRDLAAALDEGRDELAALTGTHVDTISYPHGKADERVAAAARSAGYAYGFATARATVTSSSDPLLLPRIPPALSSGKTALRVAQAVASSGAQ
jgi:peptidoglycan/xylan/chitin deacetylase (PgdA/CDA1 family)